MRYGAATLLTSISTVWASSWQAFDAQTSEAVTIKFFGHTCFLVTGNGLKVLVNPFRPLGCTAGYSAPKVEADLVLISSFLLDEGAVEGLPGNPRILTEPGDYQISGIKFQGISIPHDRENGRRFGNNIAWRWTQSGVNLLHLGGAAAPIGLEAKILMGRPDVLFVPVGGGVKAYNPQEAKEAVATLKPKVVIPTQYLTAAADKTTCDLVPVDEFLTLTKEMTASKLNTDIIAIKPPDLPPEGPVIRVLNSN
jgi:L-ascorbate metabolism protein UlaG (beta-lactamase superfamily)